MEPLQYNTKRKHLIIPEYGRHIHLMIEQTKAETDAQERNKKAKAIIGVMGNLTHIFVMFLTFNINFGINFLSCLTSI